MVCVWVLFVAPSAGLAVFSAAVQPPPRTDVLKVVGLGDSALTNDGCRCTDLLADYARILSGHLHARVQDYNAAVPGATSDDVVSRARAPKVRPAVGAAGLIVVFAGANDFHSAFEKVAESGSPQHHYVPVARHLKSNLHGLVHGIHLVNHRARIVLLGYWNDFKDGAVARKNYTKAQRRAAAEATDYTNKTLQDVARVTGTTYESTRQLFAGKAHITPYLAPDGDHLSAAGHELIAHALVDLLYPGTTAIAPAQPAAPVGATPKTSTR
jgi:lysophospholipase L1-like esterase